MVFCIDQFANVPNAFPNRLNKHTRFGDKVKDERVFGMFLRFLRLPVRIRANKRTHKKGHEYGFDAF